MLMVIGHIVLYSINEESLTSFLLGFFAMICLIISLVVSKDKSQ